jgi:hypothetical protein
MNRKIKDAVDHSTNELIYLKSHAKATYLSNGATVEDAIRLLQASSGDGDGFVELDGYVTKDEFDAIVSQLDDFASKSYVDEIATKVNGFVTEEDLTEIKTKIENCATIDDIDSIKSTLNDYATLDDIDTLSSQISNKQDKLVSGSNIKTINNINVLGNGNITIHPAYPIIASSSPIVTLKPNTYYRFSNTIVNDYILTFGDEISGIVNEYIFEISVPKSILGGTASVTIPNSVKWVNEDVPLFEAGYTYIISIVNNIAVYASAITPS